MPPRAGKPITIYIALALVPVFRHKLKRLLNLVQVAFTAGGAWILCGRPMEEPSLTPVQMELAS